LLACALGVPSAWAGPPFAREVFLRDVDGVGAILSEQALRVGVSATSTDGFDSGEDVLAPPPPPGNSDAASLSGLPSPLGRLRENYRADVPDGAFIDWVLEVVAGPGRSARLAWDAASPPGVGFLGIVRSDATGAPLMGEIETSMAPAGQAEFPGGAAGDTRHYRLRLFRGTPVTVTMDSAEGDPTGASPIPVVALFSEPVAGFGLSDIVAGNATASNLADLGGGAFSFDLAPLAAGLVTADIPAASAQSAALGIPNEAAGQFSRNFEMDVCCPGDADNNTFVNLNDYLSVRDHFGQANASEGDGDCNSFVNLNDYLSVRDHFGQNCLGRGEAPGQVPEASLALNFETGLSTLGDDPAPAVLFLNIPIAEIEIGESATVEIRLDANGQPVRLAGVFLSFDRSRLAFEGGSVNAAIFDNAVLTSVPGEAEPGIVSFSASSSAGPAANGALVATLSFRALAEGSAPLAFLGEPPRETSLLDANFQNVPATTSGGAVSVRAPSGAEARSGLILR
jgi:hypothetical protein